MSERSSSAEERYVLGVVPCYNVGSACLPVLRGLRPQVANVLAVDDGSTDETPAALASSGVEVLTHPRNRGKGAALLSAFGVALERGYGAALTVDGDGQHRPEDVPALLAPFLEDGAELVVGVRQVRWGAAPLRNWLGNALSGAAFSWLSGSGIRDCQSGFRLYSRRFLLAVLPRLRPGRYETEMELLLFAAGNGFRIAPVPIRTIYDEQSRRLSHFQPLRDTVRVVAAMARGASAYRLAARP